MVDVMPKVKYPLSTLKLKSPLLSARVTNKRRCLRHNLDLHHLQKAHHKRSVESQVNSASAPFFHCNTQTQIGLSNLEENYP